MICPFCKNTNTRVVDKRDRTDYSITRRRRECTKCKMRFSTYERIENIDLEVIKKSGRIEPFNSEKLRRGITLAVQKYITSEVINEIIERIESRLTNQKGNKVLSSKIGDMVLEELQVIDKLSYLRFASIYKKV
jgi:transcriptional repressor NrdR